MLSGKMYSKFNYDSGLELKFHVCPVSGWNNKAWGKDAVS